MSEQQTPAEGDTARHIAEIEERLERATAGEWKHVLGVVYAGDYASAGEPDLHLIVESGQSEADATFIAAAPTDIGWLLAEHKRQRVLLAEARGAMQADAERLLAASQRVGMPPVGCDTAYWLAEEVLELRGKLAEAEAERDALAAKLAEAQSELSLSHNHVADLAAGFGDALRRNLLKEEIVALASDLGAATARAERAEAERDDLKAKLADTELSLRSFTEHLEVHEASLKRQLAEAERDRDGYHGAYDGMAQSCAVFKGERNIARIALAEAERRESTARACEQAALDSAKRTLRDAENQIRLITVCETDGRPCHTTHHGGCACHERRHAADLLDAMTKRAEADTEVERLRVALGYIASRPDGEDEPGERNVHRAAWRMAQHAKAALTASAPEEASYRRVQSSSPPGPLTPKMLDNLDRLAEHTETVDDEEDR